MVVCSSQFMIQGLLFIITLSDVGSRSVGKYEHYSLACIPLHWMIRQCCNANTGIIFNTCAFKHKVGFDMKQEMGEGIGPTLSPHDLLPPSGNNSALVKPENGEFEGYSFWRIPATIILGLSSPFCWAGNKLHNLFTSISELASKQKVCSEGEAKEDHKDVLSPIYNQMKMHFLWKILDFIPCKFCLII